MSPAKIGKSNDFTLPEERRKEILRILEEEGRVAARNLSVRLCVSEDTIRRDLKDLDRARQLSRVHGGALPRSPSEAPFVDRETHNPKEKRALAQKAATLIEAGQTVFVDGGTTSLEVVRHLPSDLKATIITNSPPAVMALGMHPSIEVIQIGGQLNKASMTLTGSSALAAIRQIRTDLFIFGVCSLDPEIGLTTTNFEEAELKRTIIQNAAEVIAVTTADKLGTSSPYFVSEMESITQLITDSKRSQVRAYEAAGISVTLVKT